MNPRMRTSSALAAMVALLAVAADAQRADGPLTGRVVDAQDRPVAGVLVFVEEGAEPSISTRTGEDGAFLLPGVAPGTHRVGFRREGFAPRTVALTVETTGDREVGPVTLQPGPGPTATLVGTVSDADGSPLAGAEVELNGEVSVLTDEDGGFRLTAAPVAWGTNRLSVRHLSYADESDDFWIGDPDRTVPFDVTLQPAPVEVAGVVAGGARRPDPALAIPGFREREASTNGHFIDRTELEENNPSSMLDVLRGVPGLRMSAHPEGTEIRLTRRTRSLSFRGPDADRCMSPVFYVDGVQAGGSRGEYVEVETLVNLEDVAGIEVYNGAARIPTVFNTMGSGCGVIAIWTTRALVDPSTLAPPSSRARLGPDMREEDSGVSFMEVAIGSAVVGGVAILFWKAVCAQPHFCQ